MRVIFSLLFFSICAASSICNKGLTKDVSSVVGAPWRRGALTTLSGIAGIGLGHLLGSENDSTPQEWSGGSCLSKRSLSRLYYCCCFWRELTEVTVKIYKSLRINLCKRVPSHLGVKTPGDSSPPPPSHPEPSTTHSCESSRATKTPLRKRPDGGQMTARSKGLRQRVSGFQRAIPLKHRLCTPSTPRHHLFFFFLLFSFFFSPFLLYSFLLFVDVLTLLVVLFVFETPPLREHVGVLPQTPHVMARKVW